MLSMREFERFRHLHFSQQTVQLAALLPVFVSCTVNLPDGQSVLVRSLADPLAGKYSYVLTKFGVVTLYDDEGDCVGKSELCKQLDVALLQQLDCKVQAYGAAQQFHRPTEEERARYVAKP